MTERKRIVGKAAEALDLGLRGQRETWLMNGFEQLRPLFEAHGYALPYTRVSCSWPGGGSPKKRIGECWPRSRSSGSINEIFISPVLDASADVLDVLAHEMAHAVDDCKSGHGAAFRRIGTAIGLVGKATSMHAGPELRAVLELIADDLGPYPHKRINMGKVAKEATDKPKKGSTVEKFSCDCGFAFSVGVKIIEENPGPYCCPACQTYL